MPRPLTTVGMLPAKHHAANRANKAPATAIISQSFAPATGMSCSRLSGDENLSSACCRNSLLFGSAISACPQAPLNPVETRARHGDIVESIEVYLIGAIGNGLSAKCGVRGAEPLGEEHRERAVKASGETRVFGEFGVQTPARNVEHERML